ncbi:MAG: ABC transporter ATP-binding protein [Erysipelothrix sp.]|nr:ABC transporter ATP-binding protein [Erysipelothrix sp.]
MIKKRNLLWSLVFAIVGNFAMVLTPFYLGLAIDAMVSQGNVDLVLVKTYLSYAVILYIVSFVFVWISNNISFSIASDFVTSIRDKVQNKLATLPLSYLDVHPHGKLTNMLSNDSDLILDGLFQAISKILGGLVIIVVATIFMLRINTTMTFVVYLTLPFVYISSHIVSKVSGASFRSQQDLAGQLNGFVSESIYNHKLILNYNYQETILNRFKSLNDQYNIAGQRAQFTASLTNPTTRVVNNLSYAIVGLVGAMTILNGNLTVGLFTSFISYSLMFAKPFNELSGNLAQVFAAKAGYENIQSLLNIKSEVDTGTQEIMTAGHVSFEDVSFAYQENNPLIENLDLEVKPKQKIAIVGPTGAGKSTLINILMRYYEVDSGKVYLDGVDIRQLSRQSLHENISIVLQDPWLFEGTILENLKYGREDATMDAVIEAAKAADVHEFISSLDKGYETMIQKGARNISGGQKQLLTIARALLQGGPILILDEATSNIDSLTEKRIQSVFTTIMKQHTTFFIAHRLSTVIDSDLILVMKQGNIVEKGTHRELMDKKGFYYTLYQSQF